MKSSSRITVHCETKNKTWSKDFFCESEAKNYMRAMSQKYRATCRCDDLINPLSRTTKAPAPAAVEQAKRDAQDWTDGRIAEWIVRGGQQEDGMTPELVAQLKRRYNR